MRLLILGALLIPDPLIVLEKNVRSARLTINPIA